MCPSPSTRRCRVVLIVYAQASQVEEVVRGVVRRLIARVVRAFVQPVAALMQA